MIIIHQKNAIATASSPQAKAAMRSGWRSRRDAGWGPTAAPACSRLLRNPAVVIGNALPTRRSASSRRCRSSARTHRTTCLPRALPPFTAHRKLVRIILRSMRKGPTPFRRYLRYLRYLPQPASATIPIFFLPNSMSSRRRNNPPPLHTPPTPSRQHPALTARQSPRSTGA